MSTKNTLQDQFKNSVNFYTTFSDDKLIEIRKRVYDAPPEKRKEIWKTFFDRKSNLSINKLEKLFIEMAKERERFAVAKGYKNTTAMFLERYKIPTLEYKKFLKNIELAINICNRNLPKKNTLSQLFYSEFSSVCFICNQKAFPFKDFGDVLRYFENNFEDIKKYKSKLFVKLAGRSEMFYRKENDLFEINIDKNGNARHKTTDLFHELCHVVSFLQNIQDGIDPYEVGKYEREKEATKLEFEMLKRDFSKLYTSTLGNILRIFKTVIFEIELYKNPNRNLSKLYAECFNRCYKDGDQKTNPTYVIEPEIVLTHFTLFAHAIACANILTENQKSRKLLK